MVYFKWRFFMEAVPNRPDFQALFESSPGLYLVIKPNSPDFTIIAVSNAYLKATMTKREDILGKGIFQVFPDNPNDPKANGERNLRTSLERVVISKEADPMAIQKYDVRRPDSQGGSFEERFWSPLNTPLLDERKEIIYIIHRVEDVTEFVHLQNKGHEQEKLTEELKQELERKEIEILSRAKEREDAHSSGELARIILDRMYQFVGLLDAEGRFLEINKPALDGSGLKKSDVVGSFLWEVSPWKVSEENPKKVHRAYLKAAQGEFVREEIELFAGAGGTQIITIDFSLMPIRNEEGKIAFFLGEGRNITEKKLADAEIEKKNVQLSQLNERLKQLDQLKTQFFANVSHELRTPLTLILGPAEKIKESSNLSAIQKFDMEVIIRNARLLLKHVNDLLDVARLEAGKITPSYVEFNLSMMIKAIGCNFEGLAREKNITLGTNVPDSLLVQADPNMIQRVILNLVGNAFKFTPSGGIICIEARAEEDEIFITVKDTGPGIPFTLREEIFERFKQGEDHMTKKFAGTGLGLSIAKEFTQLHQGSISVSDNIGGGAQFVIKLPIKAATHIKVLREFNNTLAINEAAQNLVGLKGMTPHPERSRSPKNPKGLVLIVEDNEDLNRFLSDILSAHYTVETAFNGKEGLDKALSVKPDLILSDIMMPHMSGDVMVKEIRKHSQLDNTPIMLLTAKADEELRIALLKGGAQDYVLKPFFSEEVLARANNLISIKRSTEELQRDLETTERDLQMLTVEVTRNRHHLKIKAQELEKINGILHESIEARDEFLSIASHELKTPVSTLKLQLELMDRKINLQKKEAPSLEVLKKSFDMSLKQVDVFVELINELMDVSRIRLGRMVLHPTSFNFSTVLSEIFENYSPQFTAVHCPVQLMVDEDMNVQWDLTRTQEIVTNLFSNAIKYAPGTAVQISAHKTAQETIILMVEDHGPGIPKKLQHKIFERFGRTAPANHVGGLGLGLFIVKNLVEAHQGKMHLESDEGKGAKFIVELPIKAQVMEPGEVPNESK